MFETAISKYGSVDIVVSPFTLFFWVFFFITPFFEIRSFGYYFDRRRV
jgi:hypothetical protein